MNRMTCLHFAMEPNICRFLIEKGINVDEENIYLETALHIAVGKQKVEIVDILISHQANLNLFNVYV